MKNSLNCWVFAAMLMLKCHTVHAYDFEANGIYYNIESSSDLTVSVTYYDFNYNKYYIGNISIPSTVTYLGETYSVTSIGKTAFFNSNELTGINIPNSVINIENAFAYCPYLTNISVDEGNEKYDSRNNCNAVIETATNKLVVGCQNTIIPESVTSIGDVAYFGCYNLTSLNIPNNVTHIGKQAFQNNRDLTSINIPKSIISIGEKAFHRCFHLTSITVDPNNSVYDSRNNCNAIIETSTNTLIAGCKNTIIPNSLTSIGEYAFYQCTGLTSIEIPNSLTSIGGSAFAGTAWYDNQPDGLVYAGMVAYYYKGSMPNNTNLILKDGTLGIADDAFSGCTGLTNIEIPNSVTSIGSSAFNGCSGLTSIVVATCNSVYDSRNNCNAIIETSTNTLIAGCKNTIIPNSVTSIGEYAFRNCKGLTSIEIPNSVTSIGSYAFSGCTGLTSIEIPNSVTSIGEYSFLSCTGLTSIEIPNSVTSIGTYAFRYCKGLTSITVLSTTPVSIGSDTFSNRANATLYVPKGSKAAYEAADYWKEFKEIVEIEVPIELDITDGEVLVLKHTETCDELVYTRTFSNTHWQALYVPFSIPVDSLRKYGLQVAELNDTHLWDFNGDGVADSTRVEFFTLTSGNTEANYPYLIRATEPTTLSLTLRDIEVQAAEENSIECSSTKQKFTFVGTYTGVSGADMYYNNYYGMSGGGLKRVSNNTVSLKPQRWYMKIENKNGSPVTYYAPSIRFIVDGIEDEAETSDLVLPTVDADMSAPMYSIEGIRQTSTQLQPGLYVRQGKKIVIR